MKFGKWLNQLDGLDHLVILTCFAVAVLIAHYVIRYLINFYSHVQRDNKYAPDLRPTPIVYFLIALPITIIIYVLVGSPVTLWLR